MSGRAAGAYSRRFSELEAWQKQPDNKEALKAVCKVHKVRLTDTVAVLWLLVLKMDVHSGLVSVTLEQLADTTWLSTHTIRRALKALDAAGIAATVYKGRRGPDGKGRAAGRRVLFLAGDNSSEKSMSVQSVGYERASDDLPACTQVHTTTVDTTTEDIITPEKVFATVKEPEQVKSKSAQSDLQWSRLLVETVASDLASLVKNQRNPPAVRMSFKMKATTATSQVFEQYGLGVTKMSPETIGWSDLLMVTKCIMQDELVSRATHDALLMASWQVRETQMQQ